MLTSLTARDGARRAWAAAIALAVVAAMVVQVVIVVGLDAAPHDVTPGVVRGSSLPGRLIRLISFFTIQSNLLSGLVCAQLARRPDRDGPLWRVLRLTALVCISVTGIVYSTVLARIHQPDGAAETFVNIVFHYVVPILMVIGWLAFGPRPRIDRRVVLYSLVFPAAWLAYTLVRGAIWSWYPYPFLDVPSHGYLRVAGNSVAVLLVLLAVAAVFALGDRYLRRTD